MEKGISMAKAKNENKKICFVIAPIGDEESDIRRRSDQVFNHIIEKAAKECKYETIRADKLSKPGIITHQIIQHLINDPLVIADLTGKNPNVFYELAIRHATKKPTVQIIQTGESIPFDVAATRIIKVNYQDLDSAENCRKELIDQIHSVEDDPNSIDTPLSMTIDLNFLSHSKNPLEKSNAEMISTLHLLSPKMDDLIKLFNNFSTESVLIKGSQEAQMKSLFLDCMSSKIFKETLKECMENSKNIKMLGTTLRQFFTHDQDLRENLFSCAQKGKKLYLLMSSPFEKCVVKRTLLEQGEIFETKCKINPLYYKLSDTYLQIKDVLQVYQREFKEKDNVHMKYYVDYPSMWLVITDNCAFFQPYQYGGMNNTISSCMGENFIVMRFGKGPIYELLNKHFDIIWSDKNNIEPDDMLKKYENDEDIIKETLSDQHVYWR